MPNVSLVVNETKTFSLVESIPCGEKNSAKGPTKRVPERT